MSADASTTDYRRFERMGLDGNPFRVLEGAELLNSFIPCSGPGFEDLLNVPAVQFLGGKGHGKTTHLCALAQAAESRGERVCYQHLPEGTNRAVLPNRPVDRLALDEVQRLSRIARKTVFDYVRATGCRLNVASHTDWTLLFARTGLVFHSLQLDRLDVPWVIDYFNRRLELARTTTVHEFALRKDAAQALAAAADGNVYALECNLYLLFDWLSRRNPGPKVILDPEILREAGCLPRGAPPG